jgi:hypothetical protein
MRPAPFDLDVVCGVMPRFTDLDLGRAHSCDEALRATSPYVPSWAYSLVLVRRCF